MKLLFLAILAITTASAHAHEVRPAYLQLRQTDAETYDLLWKVPARAGGMRLSLDVVFPDACADLAPPTARFVADSFVQQRSVRYPGGLAGKRIVIAGLEATMTDALARVERLDGTTQIARLTPASPSFIIEDSPSPLSIARTYLILGVEHILLGIDHLLFVLALLLLVRGRARLITTITAFTLAHSITLAGAVLGFIHVPGPPVETLIALSIVLVAAEAVRAARGERSLTAERPWLVAFTFGLLHGLGFAGALSEVGLPQSDIPIALLLFNVGVEAGQLLFIAGALAIFALVQRHAGSARTTAPALHPAVRIAPAYAIGALATLWTIERASSFML